MRPLVSILFPCFNAEKYLHYSLESILAQDYSNLQVICINDGSRDSTLEILKEYMTADTRIEILNLEKNQGLIASLNAGIKLVKGEFFARMDADDYCPPERIALQMDFIESNPQYDLVSGGYNYFVDNEKPLEYVPPVATKPRALKFISLFSTPLTHAAVLGKSKILKREYFYDQAFPHSEDYELFSRLALKDIPMANLARCLYWVRLNPESVSVIHNEQQINSHLKITERNIELFYRDGVSCSRPVLKIISNRINIPVSLIELQDAIRLLDHYYNRQVYDQIFDREELIEIKHYYNLHKVNILIQSNKVGFKVFGLKHFTFFISSLSLLKWQYFSSIWKKLIIYLKYRTF